MGFLDTTAKILDTTARALNAAAFGDIRDVFKNGPLYDFRMRPIGLYQKSYGFMLDHIYRNIGNAEYVYDGYSTPIGELCNPFYNTITRVPWFYLDDYKNSTANYLEYIRDTYGAALSVENINTNDLFHLSEDAAAVGVVEGEYAIEALSNDSDLIPNVNETGTDTYMALESGYFNRETLKNAVVANDARSKYKNHITDGIYKYLGLTTENVTEQNTYSKQISPDTGRFEDGVFSPLEFTDNPLESTNYGHYYDIGSYVGYYNSLSEKSKKYYNDNVYARKKLYYPSVRNNGETIKSGKTYLSKVGVSAGHENLTPKNSNGLETVSVDELQIRYVFDTLEEHSNISDIKNGGVYVYTENEYGSSTNITYASFNAGTKFSRYTSYGSGLTAKDLLYKTNESFKNGSYKTIMARFHTNFDEASNTDTTQTAVSKKYGMSHGRNLLKLTPDKSEGYDNPYCRVWTFHHQYHRLADAIRPIPYTAEELYSKYNFSAFTADHSQKGFENGRVRLEKYGAKNKNNGLVNITPIDSDDESKKVDIRNCMFSIENLAWKECFSTDAESRKTFQAGGLSAEQKGPFGGRIMWFPPYDLKFTENVSVNWNETNFIGRGEGIYTYTNTNRSGTLSFKLLVDHPSIINYWENKGKSVSNSVDDIDDPEQQILRFFAGCDMLTGKPGPTPEPQPVISDEPMPSPDTRVLKFFVFYPNNYSGHDDDADFAMKYLTNGLGAGKERRWHLRPNGNCYIEDKVTDYIVQYAKAKTDSGNVWGGYEMRPGMPISIVREQDRGNIQLGGRIAEIKVGDYGNGVGCNDGKTSLYIQEGTSTDVWWQRKWYYRVDKAYQNQLLKKESYVDKASYCLNSNAGRSKVIQTFGVEDASNLYSLADVYVALEGGVARSVLEGLYDESKVSSFLNKIKQYGVDHVECIGRASTQGYNNLNTDLQLNRAKTVQKWLGTKSGFDASKITASTGGTGGEGAGINSGNESSISNKLWRCAEINIYLKGAVSKTVQASLSENFMPTTSATRNTKAVNNDGVNEGTHHQTNFLNTPQQTVLNSQNMGIERVKNFNDLSSNKLVEERALKDRVTSIRLNHLSDNLNGLALNLKSSVRNGNVNVNSVFDAVADFSEHSKHFQYDNLGFITNEMRGKSTFNFAPNQMHDNAAQDEIAGLNNTVQDKTEVATVNATNNYSTREGTNNNQVTRYDNEAKFFSMLEKEEPFLHHKISDKVKYFDPAFHSISPEGFNARLTFLQQCTRQGPTIGNSDNYTSDNTANNLSFGRPPVCILRIGDFYYTKILIDSMQFDFEQLWDLNTEGIGVMPMIANVSLNFKFIGGSSLSGHIARLQNALSFNYYANTEVYDDRSELAEYDENGNIERLGTQNLVY